VPRQFKKKPGLFRSLIAFVLACGMASAFFFDSSYLLIPFIAVLMISTYYVIFQWLLLKRVGIYREGDRLVLRDNSGKDLSEIDLSQDYEVTYVYEGYHWAIYQLRQGSIKIKFSSGSRNAVPIVRDVLRMEWPPIGRTPSPGV
jgi:hypothetical protein